MFRYGDKGDAFYIILIGSVNVTRPRDIKKANLITKQIEIAKQKVNEIMGLNKEHIVNYLTKLLQ